MPKYINGPINYAYLKGNINGIEKNIYLFMDIHNSLNDETRCESFDSIDISYYLYKKIKESKQRLDIFMEINTSELKYPITNKKDIYINEVTNLFKSEFVVEKINDNENIRYSKTNKNVRLHYLDIRDHLGLFDLLGDIKIIIKKIKLLEKSKDDETLKNEIILKLNELNNSVEELTKIKDEIINNKKEYENKDNIKKYYLNKIINKYENKKLRNDILIFLNNYYDNVLYNFSIILKKIKNIIMFDIKMINEIFEKIEFIKEAIVDLYSMFTDIFLLRRILDKNYIEKCIIYSGIQHSLNYIFFLIKYCDFKIIKIYKSEEKDISQIEKIIKKSDYPFNIYKLFYVKKKEYLQCIEYEPLYFGGNKLKIIN
jgi:hypothetical protein